MKKALLLLAAAVLATSAFAQTATVTDSTDRGYQLMRGTSNLGTPKPTEAECKAAIAPAVLAAKKTALYKCRHEMVYRGAYDATVTCAPALAPTVVTMQCPAGTTGTWQQTTTSVRGAAPACVLTTTTAPLAPPANACAPVVATPAPTGPTLYFSDCQAGAAPGCVPGSNANAGTQASPKQNLSGLNLNALPAGTHLAFARGGLWQGGLLLDNPNATLAAPLVFEDYGTGPAPVIRAQGNGVEFGQWRQDGVYPVDGGYVFRNLVFQGSGAAGSFGFFLQRAVRGVVLDGVEITGFGIGIHSQQTPAAENVGLTVRNSKIHHNSEMGMLGDAIDMVLEGNDFTENNFSGSIFNHAIYLSGHGRNGRISGNTFTNNSVVNGVCRGGNVTVHGQWDGLVIEGNTITQPASAEGCWGFSLTPGYSGSAEWFRNAVVRGNTITNLGGCAVCVISAPGIVIEGNKVFNNQPSQIAITVSPPSESSDDAGLGPVVRDNVVCFSQPNSNSGPVSTRVAGAVVSGTVYRTGADAATGACAR